MVREAQKKKVSAEFAELLSYNVYKNNYNSGNDGCTLLFK